MKSEAMEKFVKQKVPVSYPVYARFVLTRILFPLALKANRQRLNVTMACLTLQLAICLNFINKNLASWA
jgi:hypothetical protein